MRNPIGVAALALFVWGGAAQATDVINQDKKAYAVKVQGEGKLSISNHTVKAGSSMYGLCWTFEIPGHKVTAKKDGRLTIRDGKFQK
jgi:hypothetical protein